MSRQEVIRDRVEEILTSKMEELHMIGYEGVTKDEIWACVNEKYGDDWPKLHTVVNDIYTLKPMAFMNWLTIGAYKGTINIGENDH